MLLATLAPDVRVTKKVQIRDDLMDVSSWFTLSAIESLPFVKGGVEKHQVVKVHRILNHSFD
jgi:hypothetical protein